jgi:mannose/fructose/N-acetylgalactosamine-specific phosphotransferase system component IIC
VTVAARLPWGRSAAALVLPGLGLLVAAALALPGGGAGFAPGQLAAAPLLLLALWGAMVAADERALGPLVLHEPFVAAGVGGMLAGRMAEGMAVGFILQLVWPGLRPMGGSRQPVVGMGALAALGCVLALPASLGSARFAVASLAGVLAASAGVWIEQWLRRRNDWRENWLPETFHVVSRARLLISQGALEASAVGIWGAALLVALPALVAGWLGVAAPKLGLEGAATAGGTDAFWSGLTPASLSHLGTGVLLGLGFVAGGLLRSTLLALRRPKGPSTEHEQNEATGGEGSAPREDAAAARGGLSRMNARVARLFLLQAGFSHRHLQRSGFLLALFPSRGISGNRVGEAPALALRDALAGEMLAAQPPNAQPIMAAAVIGALERVLAGEPGALPRSPMRLIHMGGSVLARYGDAVIWGALRPAVAMIALLASAGSAAGAVLAWVGLDLAGEWMARRALCSWGWRMGWGIIPFRPGRRWLRVGSRVRALHLPLALLLLGLVIRAWSLTPQPHGAWAALAGWGIVGLLAGGIAARRPLAWGWAAAAALCGGSAFSALLGWGL